MRPGIQQSREIVVPLVNATMQAIVQSSQLCYNYAQLANMSMHIPNRVLKLVCNPSITTLCCSILSGTAAKSIGQDAQRVQGNVEDENKHEGRQHHHNHCQ